MAVVETTYVGHGSDDKNEDNLPRDGSESLTGNLNIGNHRLVTAAGTDFGQEANGPNLTVNGGGLEGLSYLTVGGSGSFGGAISSGSSISGDSVQLDNAGPAGRGYLQFRNVTFYEDANGEFAMSANLDMGGNTITNGSVAESMLPQDYLPRNGSEAMTGDLNVGSQNIVSSLGTLGVGAGNNMSIQGDYDVDVRFRDSGGSDIVRVNNVSGIVDFGVDGIHLKDNGVRQARYLEVSAQGSNPGSPGEGARIWFDTFNKELKATDITGTTKILATF